MCAKISKIQVFTKIIMSAILPSLNKKNHILSVVLDKLNISILDYTVSEDLKVLFQMGRKQTEASKQPCPFCMISSLTFEKLIIILQNLCAD